MKTAEMKNHLRDLADSVRSQKRQISIERLFHHLRNLHPAERNDLWDFFDGDPQAIHKMIECVADSGQRKYCIGPELGKYSAGPFDTIHQANAILGSNEREEFIWGVGGGKEDRALRKWDGRHWVRIK